MKKDELSPKKPKQTKNRNKTPTFDDLDSDLSESEFVKKTKKPFHSDSEDDVQTKKKKVIDSTCLKEYKLSF